MAPETWGLSRGRLTESQTARSRNAMARLSNWPAKLDVMTEIGFAKASRAAKDATSGAARARTIRHTSAAMAMSVRFRKRKTPVDRDQPKGLAARPIIRRRPAHRGA